MSGGTGGRRDRAMLLSRLTPNQLVVFQTADRPGEDRLGRFVQVVRGANHRAVVYPWDRVKLWDHGGRQVVTSHVRVARHADIEKFGARVV